MHSHASIILCFISHTILPLTIAKLSILKNSPFFGPPCISNKTAKSNLGKAALCHKLPTGYNGALHIHPQDHRLPWTNPQTQLYASSLDQSDLPL